MDQGYRKDNDYAVADNVEHALCHGKIDDAGGCSRLERIARPR